MSYEYWLTGLLASAYLLPRPERQKRLSFLADQQSSPFSIFTLYHPYAVESRIRRLEGVNICRRVQVVQGDGGRSSSTICLTVRAARRRRWSEGRPFCRNSLLGMWDRRGRRENELLNVGHEGQGWRSTRVSRSGFSDKLWDVFQMLDVRRDI